MPITQINADSFGDFVNCTTPVLVDFYADWCGPCQRMSAVLDEVSAARPALPVGKVNVDQEPDLARAYVVRSIPTLLLLKNGEVADRWTGEQTSGTILTAVDQETMEQPEHDALSAAPVNSADPGHSLHDYSAHTMPRMYSAPLSGLPFGTVPGEYQDLHDTWGTW
ncbi:MAG: thioredoxin family protein [Clostridia bacterium]|nr:thioredoxin family protein [Clostridia bacterium]